MSVKDKTNYLDELSEALERGKGVRSPAVSPTQEDAGDSIDQWLRDLNSELSFDARKREMPAGLVKDRSDSSVEVPILTDLIREPKRRKRAARIKSLKNRIGKTLRERKVPVEAPPRPESSAQVSMPESTNEHAAAVNRLSKIGLIVVGFFLLSVLIWFGLARMSTAAIAPGMVTVEGARKTIQHFDGGIVREVLVAEGAQVKRGELLIQLNDETSQTGLVSLAGELVQRKLNLARLAAIQNEDETITWPAFDFDVDERQVEAEKKEQQQLFDTGLERYWAQISAASTNYTHIKSELAAMRSGQRSKRRQLQTLETELARREALFSEGLAKREYVYAIEQKAADLRADSDAYRASIVSREGLLDASAHALADIRFARRQSAALAYQEEQAATSDLERQFRRARDQVERSRIVAPVAGRVLNLQATTTGGVIRPGEALMDIVPLASELVVDARLASNDRDVVRSGLPAEVRVVAFNARHTKPLTGTVKFVSADVIAPPLATGASNATPGVPAGPHYLARVAIDADSVKESGVELYPGMQAEVMIVTGKRTMLDYLFSPLMGSIGRAFTEE